MNNPLVLCELAARAPNISACHMVKKVLRQNEQVFHIGYSLPYADVKSSNWLKQRKSPGDHPFRFWDDENRKLGFKV